MVDWWVIGVLLMFTRDDMVVRADLLLMRLRFLSEKVELITGDDPYAKYGMVMKIGVMIWKGYLLRLVSERE